MSLPPPSGPTATSAAVGAAAITKTGGLVATDGFCPAVTSRGDAVLVWTTPTPDQREAVRNTRARSSPEPVPGAQVDNTRNTPFPDSHCVSPVGPHADEAVRVVYHTGYPGSRAVQYPAEFSRQLGRQYEALSYITVADYLKYRTHTTRATTPKEINDARNDLKTDVTSNLTKNHGFDKGEAKKLAGEAVEMLVALHEPDQILRGTHELTPAEVVWGNRYVNASLGPQNKTNATLLDKAAKKLTQDQNREQDLKHYYLNVEVVLCENPTLAEQIRQEQVTIIPTPPEHTLPTSPHTTLTAQILTHEILGRAPPTTPTKTSKQTRTESTKPGETTEQAAQIRNILKTSFPKPPTPTNPANPTATNKPRSYHDRTRTIHNKGIER